MTGNRSLLMIKPFAFQRGKEGVVFNMLESNEFDIIAIKTVRLTKKEAEFFYQIHSERPFFQDLIEFMTSGKVIAVCVEKLNCVKDLRILVGATDPSKAKDHTVRKEIGTNLEKNGVHASDSDGNAKNEIRFFFSDRELLG